jgi:hypothetical protein
MYGIPAPTVTAFSAVDRAMPSFPVADRASVRCVLPPGSTLCVNYGISIPERAPPLAG